MKKIFLCVLMLASVAMAAPVSFTSDLNKLLSKLQSMGRDSYSQAEWNEVYRQIDDIEGRAKSGEAWDALVEARVIHAMVLGDMQKNYQGAIDLLKQTRKELHSKNIPEMKRVYVKMADMYGKMGDEAAVNQVIEEFRASPYYDAQDYPFSGGKGPTDPLLVTRPGAAGSGSISETAMKVAQDQARFSAGATFPEFELVDAAGVTITRKSVEGKVVLYDFWLKDWTAWKNDLKNLTGTYDRYHNKGFEIVGISMDSNVGDLAAFARANGMWWPQVAEAKKLTKQLGIFGDCSNILVGRDGVIIGRNLRGADLVDAVKRALAK